MILLSANNARWTQVPARHGLDRTTTAAAAWLAGWLAAAFYQHGSMDMELKLPL